MQLVAAARWVRRLGGAERCLHRGDIALFDHERVRAFAAARSSLAAGCVPRLTVVVAPVNPQHGGGLRWVAEHRPSNVTPAAGLLHAPIWSRRKPKNARRWLRHGFIAQAYPVPTSPHGRAGVW